jgi:hypothetical protein
MSIARSASEPDEMKKNRRPEGKKNRAVIPLGDLAPRKDPKGGAGEPGKIVFGGGGEASQPETPEPPGKKDRKRKP